MVRQYAKFPGPSLSKSITALQEHFCSGAAEDEVELGQIYLDRWALHFLSKPICERPVAILVGHCTEYL